MRPGRAGDGGGLPVDNWHVYLIRTGSGALYTGITTDVERRFREHCDGARGARALRGKGPLQLVYSRRAGDRSAASRLELAIKRLPKPRKEALLAGTLPLESLLPQAGLRQSQPPC